MSTSLTTHIYDNTLVVALPADFSGMAVEHYRDQFDELLNAPQSHLVLDFSGTDFIDSSGIGAMVFLYKRLARNGMSLELFKVSGQPHKLMTLLRVDRTIGFIDQLKSA